MIVKVNWIQSTNQMLVIPNKEVRLTNQNRKNKFWRQLKTKQLHKINK